MSGFLPPGGRTAALRASACFYLLPENGSCGKIQSLAQGAEIMDRRYIPAAGCSRLYDLRRGSYSAAGFS